jgi:hypothetical protein
MKFFGKSESKRVEEEIAQTILQQEDRLGTLFSILGNLPEDLVEWFKGLLKAQSHTKGYVEVDLAQGVNLGIDVLPSDIVIRKNRDPKPNDIVEIGMRRDNGYFVQAVKVIKINFKEGTLFVHNLLESDSKGSIAINNVICVIDKVIKYTDPEWKKTVQILDIDYDIDELQDWVEKSIEFVKKEKFYDKENTLKLLQERLKLLNKK